MGNSLRAVSFSLCTLISSAISRDSRAWSMINDLAPECGWRVDATYTVGPTDNLWSISRKVYGATVEFSHETGKLVHLPQAIAAFNGLIHGQIYDGQTLVIPKGQVVSGGECPADIRIKRASEYVEVRELGEL